MALVDYFNVSNPKLTAEETITRGKPIIESLFKTIMGIQFQYLYIFHFPIGIFQNCNAARKESFELLQATYGLKGKHTIKIIRSSQYSFYHKQSITWNGQPFEIYFPLCMEVDELAHVRNRA